MSEPKRETRTARSNLSQLADSPSTKTGPVFSLERVSGKWGDKTSDNKVVRIGVRDPAEAVWKHAIVRPAAAGYGLTTLGICFLHIDDKSGGGRAQESQEKNRG